MLRTCYSRQVGDRKFATFRRKVASALADGKSEMILIIVESFLSLPSVTRPFSRKQLQISLNAEF
ncbi:MAG: hypothetical protein LBB88_05725 [Planctomycetaceae bacterium]|jgi:hypothetical protein|nr:hypothetical protein [Planctomycetaceae bacterium]